MPYGILIVGYRRGKEAEVTLLLACRYLIYVHMQGGTSLQASLLLKGNKSLLQALLTACPCCRSFSGVDSCRKNVFGFPEIGQFVVTVKKENG